MTLFEATNGSFEPGYVRVYVWAATEKRAIQLARARFEQHGYPVGRLRIRSLFDDGSSEFCTVPSESGWEWD
jgi:hypothetical protein